MNDVKTPIYDELHAGMTARMDAFVKSLSKPAKKAVLRKETAKKTTSKA